MEKRINIGQIEPEGYKSLFALEKFAQGIELTKIQKELIKIRASQINGCAFCLDMHTKDALKYGENPRRIFVLSAWRETDLFTEEEQALLALTEEVTLIHQHGVSPETYQKAITIFGKQRTAQIIVAIIAINAWNRIGISTLLPLPE
ncbi:hypothetical protein A9P82_07840 [Arachidicoccus ginsenosidimutans]|uniref:carboxymuconolactone decarboxylase family protein n=1 Tax=Arachidicoccus sp. BS20 TaxID=1850526 RepID=UPI0007F086C2|nr:carboxymuconolactone decarboxylase family protein [Arachidicoccus sp. BS20]ANI89210.1 hypothetical protein A9P82_07840 [Arachidicoccus sp. BS20]